MHKKAYFICVFLLWTLIVSFLLGCSGGSDSTKNHTKEKRTTSTEFLSPSASGEILYGNEIISIDASNTSKGYVMVQYTGSSDKVKLQITTPNSDTYSYNLATGSYETFPLSAGNGTYEIAANIQANYIPVIYSTLDSGKGICFDYASLMAAMLRFRCVDKNNQESSILVSIKR